MNSYGNTKIFETERSRDHTENILIKNKKSIKVINKKKKEILVYGKKDLDPIHINVPGDPSSAAFFTALTLLNKNTPLENKDLVLNSTSTGFYKLLKKNGANIKFKNLKKENNEIRGNIIIKSSKLKPIKASKKYYVNSTDDILYCL